MTDPESHPKDGHPITAFPDAETYEAWLEAHYDDVAAVWMKFAKKSNPDPGLSYVEAVHVALCFGWVDGQAGRYDEDWYLVRFTPRKKRSIWSKINVDRVATLTAAGRMRPSGLAAVEQAKATGHWEAAYEGSATIEVPADLQAFFDANPTAAEFFAGLSSVNRYAFLFRLKTAVRPQTRANRFEKFTAMLLARETFH